MLYRPDESFALQCDAADPLRDYRREFHLPGSEEGAPVAYLCGHSLGLQPLTASGYVEQELHAWAKYAVDAHFKSATPWYSYHEVFREVGAHLVGALPGEVVMMNSLTVNLHLMLATFYRPTRDRPCILTDEPAFPSDRYALESQVRHHGYDPEAYLLTLRPRAGEHTLRTEDIVQLLAERGPEIAVVMLNGVNFLTGQWYDMEAITRAAHAQGCLVGWDLAHAAGNVVLRLHDWKVDFAVWCSYKYLNSGPGAVAGCFVHQKHGDNVELPRLAGWWGNDPATRFRMHLEPHFLPRAGADGWQLSNPPILAMAPLRASLALFDRATMPALRAKSESLTGYLEYLLDQLPAGAVRFLTPRQPAARGCMLTFTVAGQARELLAALEKARVVCDLRGPNVLRVAPVPLYNTYHDVWRFAQVLLHVLRRSAS